MGEGDTIRLAPLLQNLSGELERLTQVATRLDAIVGDMAVEDGGMTFAKRAQLQEMDELRQALVALCRLTANASTLVPGSVDLVLETGALSQGVTLEAVRMACLAGSRPGGRRASPQNGTDIQNVTLFY